jgi:hypothetical protein
MLTLGMENLMLARINLNQRHGLMDIRDNLHISEAVLKLLIRHKERRLLKDPFTPTVIAARRRKCIKN